MNRGGGERGHKLTIIRMKRGHTDAAEIKKVIMFYVNKLAN